MTQKQAAVTVTDASGVKDLVVPLGTTVTGLLSMLDIDSSDPSLQITGADGRPLNLGAVLGTDLPQGVLISITSGRERQRQEQRAIERASDPWFRPSLALSICALLAFAMDAVLIFCTLFAQLLTIIAGVPLWAPLTIGVLSLALCLVVLYQKRVHSNAGLLSGWTLAAGLSFLGVLPAVGSNGRCTWALALASHSPHKRTRTQLGRSHGKCDCLDLSQCFSDQSCALRNRLRGMRNHRLAQLVSTDPRDPAAGYAPRDDLRAHCPRTRGSLSFAHYRPPRQPHRH